MSSRIIFLTGLPGVGKTYWGKKWADENDWNFVDLDELILSSVEDTISDLLIERTWTGFRTIEGELLEQLARHSDPDTIVATGGGAILNENSRKIIKEFGCMIWLQAPLELIYERIISQPDHRPLLQDNTLATLRQLKNEREPFYAASDIYLDVSAITPQTFQSLLEQCTSKH